MDTALPVGEQFQAERISVPVNHTPLNIESIIQGLQQSSEGNDLQGARLLLTREIVSHLDTNEGMAELQNLLVRLNEERSRVQDESQLARLSFMEARVARRVNARLYVDALREGRVQDADRLWLVLQGYMRPGTDISVNRLRIRFMGWAGLSRQDALVMTESSTPQEELEDNSEQAEVVEGDEELSNEDKIVALHAAIKIADVDSILRYYEELKADLHPGMRYPVIRALAENRQLGAIAGIFARDEVMRDVIIQVLHVDQIIDLFLALNGDELKTQVISRIGQHLRSAELRAAPAIIAFLGNNNGG